MSEPYRGDAELDSLLTSAGVGRTAAEVRAIAAGAAAAPAARDAHAWTAMVGPAAALAAVDGLAAQLDALYAEVSAAPADDEVPGFADRLAALRIVLATRRLSGLVVPRADAHPGEFLPRRAERLAWLTGFSGSAGMAVVLEDRAAIFVDGRYTLQVRDQVDGNLYEVRHLIDEPPAEWIAANLKAGSRLGFDPWLHMPNHAARLRAACERAKGELVACADDPFETIWQDRPPMPLSPMVPQPEEFAGEAAAAKRARIADALAAENLDAAFLASAESIAWLLNVRGGDVPFTPLSLAFALIGADAEVDLFVDARKVPAETRRHLGNGVRLHEPATLGTAFDALGAAGRRVRVDRDGAPAWAWQRLADAGAAVVDGVDPCVLPKACKNANELTGMRAAHVRDGVAMVRFLAWLAETAPRGGVTELDAAAELEGFRAAAESYRGPSFETISGAGANGAIVHYRSTEATNRELEPGSLYLVDSGGQYLDGTTDITRTVAVGLPSPEMRDRFTRVLRGHIALATATFPTGTTGGHLDALARKPLWDVGLDYDHGTGHGVGCYLGVHEGPARIARAANSTPLAAGMVLSNEPGYYKAGAYGIRIENLVAVVERPELGSGNKRYLGFETLTIVPIDSALIDRSQMSAADVAWVDAYHARVRETLAPMVDGPAGAWLEAATRPLD